MAKLAVEQTPEKIELSLVSDFKSEYRSATKISSSLADAVANFDKQKQGLVSDLNKNISTYKELLKPYDKIVASTKELGLNINDVLDDRPNLNRDISTMNDFISLLNK